MSAMPILDVQPIQLPVLAPTHQDLWDALCDIADRHTEDWVLVGGQMVLLHALQSGRAPHRVSQDLDTVIDARVRPPVLTKFLKTLDELGFTSVGVSADEVAHRFGRGKVHIDVLAPEGLGRRAPIRTVGTATTVEIAGGTQALTRGERVPVIYAHRQVLVPRPSLLGAIVIKAAAANHDRAPQRHLIDLAFLCSLVTDPLDLRAQVTPKDRVRLRDVTALNDVRHNAWRVLENPDEAYAALQILSGLGR